MRNRLIKNALMLLAVSAFTMTSCKKDEDGNGGSNSPSMTRTQMLVGNNWVTSSVLVNAEYGYGYCTTPDADGNYELFPDCFDECDLDDFLDFETDSTYTDNEGMNICSGGDPIICEGEWAFNTNETMLELDSYDCGYQEFEIVSISSTQLVLSQTFGYGGTNITFTYTYN